MPARLQRLHVHVRGVVQGVGFRPFVYRTANTHRLSGWVRNGSDGVTVEIQGTAQDLEEFLSALRADRPAAAVLNDVRVQEIPLVDGDTVFEIRASEAEAAARPSVPADLATCGRCLDEVRRDGERRHGYPFTNCTDCGPRYSIIERVPYDRPHTSMSGFAMCEPCRAEYSDPSDRRFHAQPIACPQCGPHLTLLDEDGKPIARRDEALAAAAAALIAGRIVALQGLGGFQLLVDATQDAAVASLRQRKHRGAKPFALLVANVAEASRMCEVSAAEKAALESSHAPIMLMRKRPDAREAVAESIAPDVADLGLMLACTPLHHLILTAVRRPLVCTSGNISEEPICVTSREAVEHLGGIADVFLTHDRPILRPLDDSVARHIDGGLQLLRRARGYVPLPIELGRPLPSVLALGAHLKGSVALGVESQAILSQHLGDLDGARARDLLELTTHDLVRFFCARPRALACDLHPDYASTLMAEHLASSLDLPLIRVQHHHAHVAACMAEYRLDGEVLGFAWDGTGFGPDGTVWGGELLRCSATDSQRVGWLRPFPLIGGDRAAREPRRCALGLLHLARGEEAFDLTRPLFGDVERRVLRAMLERRVNSPLTSSVGRLFDGVAALVGLMPTTSFEGQASLALEALALEALVGPHTADEKEAPYPMPWRREVNDLSVAPDPTPLMILDWLPTVEAVLRDTAVGVPPEHISARFHGALSQAVVEGARLVGLSRVVLSGGCFQNRRLLEESSRALRGAGFEVFTPRAAPPNDGGISLGQLWVAAHRLQAESARRKEEIAHVSRDSWEGALHW